MTKLSAFFSLLILILGLLKSYLRNELESLTFIGFIEAVVISLVAGTVAGIAIYLKDEKDK